MARTHQFVQKDQGGELDVELVSLAPVRWDVATAPTVTLLEPDGTTELVASQAATLGPATTVDTAGAAAGDTEIPVDDTTGLTVRRQYRLGPNGLGQWEWVTLAGVNASGGGVTVRDELSYSYAAGDALESHRLSVTVSAADADAVRRACQARWAFEVGGQARHETTLWGISVWSPQCPLTDQDILRRSAQAANLIGSRQLLSELIEDLWDELLGELAVRVDPGAWVSGQSLREALLKRVLAELPVANADDPARDRYWLQFEAAWARVLSTGVADTDGDGIIGSNDSVSPACVSRLYRGG